MKRPDVTLANCDEVYDFYEHYDADPRRARFAHALLGTLFKPDVTMLDDETEALLQRSVTDADVTILASKHVNMYDPVHLVALTRLVSVLEDFAGRTIIPSKRPLFDLRIRRWIDDLGAIPTYRRKDYTNPEGIADEDSKLALHHATERLVTTCARLMGRGKNLAIFPEAERSAMVEGSDPSRINPLKDGIARMYLEAVDAVTITIVPMGLCYGEGKSFWARRRPSMVIGRPLTKRYTDTATLMEDLAEAMQEAQTAAFDRQKRRR